MSTGVDSYDEYVPLQSAADEPAAADRRHRPGRVQLAVTFRQPDGSEDTFCYDHLYRLRLEANAKLVIEFSEHAVVVTGRNLRPLARHVANRTADLIEADPADRDFRHPGSNVPLVHRIEVTPRAG